MNIRPIVRGHRDRLKHLIATRHWTIVFLRSNGFSFKKRGRVGNRQIYTDVDPVFPDTGCHLFERCRLRRNA